MGRRTRVWRRCMRLRRRFRSRPTTTWFFLAPGQRWNHHQQQKGYPLPRHLFDSQSAIHYSLLSIQPFTAVSYPNTAQLSKLRGFAPDSRIKRARRTKLTQSRSDQLPQIVKHEGPRRTRELRLEPIGSLHPGGERTLPEFGHLAQSPGN